MGIHGDCIVRWRREWTKSVIVTGVIYVIINIFIFSGISKLIFFMMYNSKNYKRKKYD